ncbi:MAG: DUF126 domain-containing protein [Thermoproteota archaeon]|nr:DUF126 domain-containing protein [Candidatus Brockarchaeota archaeon]MBO3768005.1 DUF126 domain-containing protein [Candidatus Brockarchaeota archaeon]MBO3801687.1 DUF126 domain-containing protein [Candidatus Brockarchaeota archaeon]
MSEVKKFKVKWVSFKKFSGETLKSSVPISFLGGVDPKTGVIIDSSNSLYGKSIKDKVLLMPFGVGSTVGSYIIYALKKNLAAPIAILTYKPDIIVPSGCAISRIPYGLLSYNDWLKIEDHILIRAEEENEIVVSL